MFQAPPSESNGLLNLVFYIFTAWPYLFHRCIYLTPGQECSRIFWPTFFGTSAAFMEFFRGTGGGSLSEEWVFVWKMNFSPALQRKWKVKYAKYLLLDAPGTVEFHWKNIQLICINCGRFGGEHVGCCGTIRWIIEFFVNFFVEFSAEFQWKMFNSFAASLYSTDCAFDLADQAWIPSTASFSIFNWSFYLGR